MQFRVMICNVDEVLKGYIGDAMGDAELIPFQSTDLEQIMDHPIDPAPHLIVCGPLKNNLHLLELAQGISLAFPSVPLIHLRGDRLGFDRATLQKNGFYDAYILPFESTELQACITDLIAKIGAKSGESYRPVKIVDFDGKQPLTFDTYVMLPLNRKYVRLTREGGALNEAKLAKLKEFQVSVIHIEKKDSQKFHQFTAEQLIRIGSDKTMSETERQEKMQVSIRSIVSDIFTDTGDSIGFDTGKGLMEDCQEIVKSYVVASESKEAKLYEKLLALSENGGVYAQASNTATFAALFSAGLQIGKPEEVALAGMLCEIGLADLPSGLQLKPVGERTSEEEKIFRTHPELTIKQLLSKKMVLSERITMMIMQYRECWDGTGYPKAYAGQKIIQEAQIVGLSAELAELISSKIGKRRYKPLEAIEHICQTESGKRFDPILLRKLKRLLEIETPAAVAS